MKRTDEAKPVGFSKELLKGGSMVKTLMESLAEGVVFINSESKIVFINKRTEELFGYNSNEIIGHSLNILLPERFAERHTKDVSDYLAKPRIRPMGEQLSLAGRRKDGSEFPVAVSLSYLRQGKETYALALVTDISSLKKAESELKYRNEELDAFAHTVAHDLKSPLSVINSFCELLLDGRDELSSEEEDDFLERIAKNVHRMSNIVNELLLFSKMKKDDVESEPLDMDAIIDEVQGRLQYEIKELEADIILPQSYPDSLGYASWIDEVWANYISNALKYGGRPPRIEIGSDIQDDGYVKFWVKDNGDGIPEEHQSEVFFQGTRLAPTEIKGHGLGLSIVKRIVEKLGGKVAVESIVGKGSIFSFTLPAK